MLSVYVVADLDLYCMKIVSFRPKDIQDMEKIAEDLKRSSITFDKVEENFIRLYGDLYLMKNDPRKERLVRTQLLA